MTKFTLEAYQNEYLPRGGTEVNAIVTVKSSGGSGANGPRLNSAEIVIVDTSGSMDVPSVKIKAAREATSVAIDCIRDGTLFAVIEGTDRAAVAYPRSRGLVAASDETRAEAKKAAKRLRAGGGTAIGTWLTLAREVFAGAPGHACHAILLTDGENEHETPDELDRSIAASEGVFQCDCRGVGTDWQVGELRRIASALLGSLDIIADPADMPADFRSMMEKAMGKATGSVSLRVWTPQGAQLAFIKQVEPTIEPLTDRGTTVSPQIADYPTGTWGEESRDYHVCVNVPAREIGEEMLAARVSLVEGEEVVVNPPAMIKASWTDDEELSTDISPQVAHYTGQAELAGAIREGLDARKAGDEVTATIKLGRAVQLAAESGDESKMKQLERVVEVDDAATGTIRLKREVADADEMALDTSSTKTVRVRPSTP
jgi:hypothetical protein